MKDYDVVVIDYGVGNLLSVQRGLEFCGANVKVTNDKDLIMHASRVVLPGVGSFSGGMNGLKSTGLDEVICDFSYQGKPLMGICLGMQMLLDESEEFGLSKGLGLIPGRVIPIPSLNIDNQPQKIPHIGWSSLIPSRTKEDWSKTVLHNILPGESVYFVHSFMAKPSNKKHQIADCIYGGLKISAVIERDNILGCQFHPEKSGEVGLKILKYFLSL
jgi:imidazole glycerol-phosphate synthase subunit HisH